MIPSLSAEDCLFADLGFDPAAQGCVNYEASYFIIYEKKPDTTVGLILWQIGVIGEHRHNSGFDPSRGLKILAAYLSEFYILQSTWFVYMRHLRSLYASRVSNGWPCKISLRRWCILSRRYSFHLKGFLSQVGKC